MMRKPEQIRFDLQSNQNLSRRNIQKAYGLGNISETTLREKFLHVYKYVTGKLVRWFVEPYFVQQRECNHTITNVLEDYDRMHTILMEENDALRRTVEQLQVEMSEVHRKIGMSTLFDVYQKTPRIIQIVASLNFGDAVGNDVRAIARALNEAGYITGIFTLAIHPKIKDEGVYLINMLPELNENDLIIYHYATADELADIIKEAPCKVVLRYHNVTPPAFFRGYDEGAEKVTREGLDEIADLKDAIDYGIVVSDFNKKDLIDMGYQCPIAVAPILIPFKDYEQEPDKDVVTRYSDGKTNIVFVGRIVPNKKFEDVIACFAAYKEKYDPTARLFLVGNYQETDLYYQYLQDVIKKCGAEDVIFPGHIAFNAILAYYKVSDLFLCMSEHEGFCVPLVEAMYFETPIVAYASTAIPGTLDGSGVLVETKEPEKVAETMNRIIRDEQYRHEIVVGQKQRLKDFSYENIKEQILDEIEKVQQSKTDKVRKQMAQFNVQEK